MKMQPTYAHDLAISAVSYDSQLLHDVIARIGPQLRVPPVWVADTPSDDMHALLRDDVSRVVLILEQRLWGQSDAMSEEASILCERARLHPDSVIVVSLDADPRPNWMSGLQRCDLATAGLDGVASFALDAVAAHGGVVRTQPNAVPDDMPAPETRWPYAPIPFLAQPRAQGALRRELDGICTELRPRIADLKSVAVEHIVELHQLPHRVVARFDEVGLSFSWVPGRQGTVADGRLLVIEWTGLTGGRGVGALRTARPARERTYIAEAVDAATWCWREDAANGRAATTSNLVGEWVDGALMTAQSLPERLTSASVDRAD